MAKVLFAEDNALNRKMVSALLQKYGFECELAEDGQQAVEKYFSQDFDLVLMDVEMPVLGGIEACQQIIQRCSDLEKAAAPILALTAHNERKKSDEILASGMSAIISKPFSSKILLEMIAELTGTEPD